VAGRIRSIEKSSDLIRNRIRDLPACGIVSHAAKIPQTVSSLFRLFRVISNVRVIQCSCVSWRRCCGGNIRIRANQRATVLKSPHSCII
jgi:hypothetical protein